jgi:hypothetical protein
MTSFIRNLIVLAVTLTTVSARATIYTITATESGWYDNSGADNPSTQNYIAGYAGGFSEYWRDWFVFNLQGLPGGTITSASLSLYTPGAGDIYGSGGNGFVSPHSSEVFQVGSVSTPITSLTNGTGGSAAFNSIGAGTLWGAKVFSAADNGNTATLSLNTDFSSTAATSLGSGSIAIGGFLVGDLGATAAENIFGWTGALGQPSPTLSLNIEPAPEPSTWALLGLGAMALIAFNRAGARIAIRRA